MNIMKIGRALFSVFLIAGLAMSCGEQPEKTTPGSHPGNGGQETNETLEGLSVSDITIYHPNYHTISYTVQPASLQDEVTVRYSLPNSDHAAFIELFASDHAVHPNTVRAKSNTGGNYTVTATAYDSVGTTQQASFIVTVSANPPPVTYPTAITANDLTVSAGGAAAAITYTIEPPSLQSTAQVSYSPTAGLVFSGNTVAATSGATAGARTVTATAVNPEDPSVAVSCNFTVTVSVTAPPVISSITAGNLSVYAGGSPATIGYTIVPSSLQNTAQVSYSYSGTGLVFSGNTVAATSGAAAGARTVTATAINPADPSVSVSCNFTVTVLSAPVTTKSTTDRGGQTVAQLASTFDASATTCTVSPIDNINTFSQAYLDDYIRGVDISSIIEVEAAGGKFYDNDRYRVGDVMELLSYYGINWVRIRLWNNPYTATNQPYGGGTNDYAKAVAIAKRAKKWGMKVLLDFHYSDFWTHPGQQAVPKAWKDFANVNDLAGMLKAYTRQVLSDMYAEGAMPDMVQVGNETVGGFCGFKDGGSLPNERILLAAGLAAVREISAEYNYPIRTMLHATNGFKDNNTIDWYFGVVQNLDFDILGMSFYPMWHGDYTSFKNGLQSLANKYKKPIIVAEYSAAYTSQAGSPNGTNQYTSNADTQSFLSPGNTDWTIQGQASIIRNLNNAIMNNTVSNGVRYGIGSFWWEAAWLPLNGTAWANPASSEWYKMGLPGSDTSTQAINNPGNNPRVTWANQAFFSFTGTALPSLNAFLRMMGKPARPAS